MHHAVELILKRMESHPEDFVQGRSGQWLQIINGYKKFFNEEEGIAIREALRKINMDSMTEDIMKRMVKDEEPINHYTDSLAQSMARTKNQSIHDILAAGLDTAFKDAYANYHPAALEDLEEAKEGEMYKWVPKDYALGFDVEVNEDWKEE